MFALKHVDIGYREKNSDVILFEKLNLSIGAGEMVCLMGPNGIGKSTLIRSVAHLQPLIKGEVWLHDEPLHNANPEQIASCLSLVLTEKVNTLNIKTEEMIGYGRYPYLNWKLAFSDEDYTIINKAIQQTHIEHLKGKKMYELSDGQ
ncbi:MAG TPA: ABC transporter ATP-binding protein, partial [Cyclobacteriaceae bacterium]|nr:ABC transporter ATP-binding protein [Cyclobacteriaceae bacterium]